MSSDSYLGGRIRRATTPARLIAKGAAAAAVAQAKALRGATAEELILDPALVSVAEDIAQSLGEMKGAAMKIGQALSFVDLSMIPEEYRQALSVLQAEAPAMPYAEVERVIGAELGGRPEDVFTWFSPVPIAAASIGQVHMAHLGDRELVVKVQYPGVAKAVEADLRNAALLSLLARVAQRMLVGLVGDVDIRAVVDEIRDRVGEELDYELEARNQSDFAAVFADDPVIDIPAVVPELSTRQVLTTEYVDAMRWAAALEQPQDLRNQWGYAIARFVYLGLLRTGLVNVDTHPGNYLFHEDGRVTFLDFGCVARLSPAQVARVAGFFTAMYSDDEATIIASLVDMGLLKSGDGLNPQVLQLERLTEPIVAPQPFRYSRELIADIIAESLKLRVGVDELRVLQRLDLPPEYALLGRATVGLASILGYLEAEIDYDRLYTDVIGGPSPAVRRDMSA